MYWSSIRSLFVSIAGVAVVLGLCLSTESLAAPITVPTGLNPGDEYRLAFVSSGTRNGASTVMTDYDAFVTGQAGLSPELVALATTWQVIGSTNSVDARDHTNTNPGVDGTGVPIYLLSDTVLANDYGDLWDGSVDTFLEIDQFGNVRSPSPVYTGTESNGVAHVTWFLGAANTVLGESFESDVQWIAAGVNTNNAVLRPFYAISGTLTAVPEPTTAILLATGLTALAMRRHRLH